MVTKTKTKTPKKEVEKEEEESSGMSLDDAFADDEDVVYTETKKKKPKKEEEEDEDGGTEVSVPTGEKVTVKQSKPIEQLKKGDKVKIDGVEHEVDAQIVLIDHKVTKEMAIEVFNPKTDKDYQIRYFTNRLDVSDPELYELVNDFMYVKRGMKKLEF